MRLNGIALLVLGALSALVLRFTPIDDEAVRWIATLAPLVVIVFGAFLLYRGKQYAARALGLNALNDERPPVVYLRPFGEDESMAGQVFTAVFTPRMLSGFASNEEQLAQAVAPLGPLLGIGRPGERLPKPGATRVYASDAEWKDVVSHWLSTARLIILRPGGTEGVRWEMEHAVAMARPDRFLLLFVRVKRAEYETVARSMRDRFSIALPSFDLIRRARRVSGFFQFDEEWRASFLALKAPFWRVSSYKAMRTRFYHTLRPIFNRLGVDWRPMPVSSAKIAGIGCLGSLALTFFVLVAVSMLTPRSHSYEPAYISAGTDQALTVTAAAWQSWNVVGLQISVPGFDKPEQHQTPIKQPPELEQLIEAFEGYQIESRSLLVMADRFIYKPGIELSIDRAVQGAVDRMAAGPGISGLQYSFSRASVSGQSAVRTYVVFTIKGQRLRAESLTFISGRTMWQVVAMEPDSEQAQATLERILVSVTSQ
jgi:hypothetical protein